MRTEERKMGGVFGIPISKMHEVPHDFCGMGQLMSIMGLLYVRDCDTKQVVNDLTLFPPYPVFCILCGGNVTLQIEWTPKMGNSLECTASMPSRMPSRIASASHTCRSWTASPSARCTANRSLPSPCQLTLVNRRKVLIVSHGNAIDNGCCISAMMLYARSLDMDCIYYDYEGFGCSDGFTSCDCLERDIRVVYDYARQFFKGEDIFLLGESSWSVTVVLRVVGSVPTCHLAASLYRSFAASKASGFPCEPPLGGVILNGAVYSGRELIPCCLLPKRKDPYDNAAVISSIQVAVSRLLDRSVRSSSFME